MKPATLTLLSTFLPGLMASNFAVAGEVDVVDAKASKNSDGSYNFAVSLLHNDTGWDHYANRWELLDMNGKIIATRTLHHPHENEQPFTRSLYRVNIPATIKKIRVRGHDSVHGYGGKTMLLTIGN